MQAKALERIGRWRTFSVFVAGVGVLLAWAGFSRDILVLGIFGVVLTTLSFVFALLCTVGMRNGSRNVQKILDAAERE